MRIVLTVYIISILVLISIEDCRCYRIPDLAVLALCGAGFFTGFDLAAAAIPLAAFGITAALCAALRSSMPCGAGDAKLLSAFGLIGGIRALALSFCVAGLSAGIFAAVLLLAKRKEKKDRIPFGPFLSLGFLFCLTGLYQSPVY